MDADRSAWGDCIAREVARTDDGKTDPMSVAYGIAPMCAVQYRRLTDDMVGHAITENGQLYAENQMRAGELRLITSAILIHRRNHPSPNR